MTEQNLDDIVWLDLDKDVLFGFEKIKFIDKIARYVRAIESGADFPPVFVSKIEKGKYVLSGHCEDSEDGTENYGGHCRALAHYIAGKPLKCKITEMVWDRPLDVDVKDIFLVTVYDFKNINELKLVT